MIGTRFMADGTLTRTVVISNPQGFHLRPMDLFVRLASRFESKIELIKDGQRADGKSMIRVLTLVSEQGERLEIEASGPDAEAALDALTELFSHNFDENGTVE